MNFIFTPSLERRALIKIVTLLFNEGTVQKQLDTDEDPPWEDVIEGILRNVDKLEIASSLKSKIKPLLKPIGTEIASWRRCHIGSEVENPLKMPREFIWTPQGTIDVRRTAEKLVRREDIDVNRRYLWACYYSLEHDITILWDKIDKNGYLVSKIITNVVVTYWTSRMDDTLKWLSSQVGNKLDIDFIRNLPKPFIFDHLCYKYGSNASSYRFTELFFPESHKTVVAAEYFWNLLTPQEKDRFASRYSVQPRQQSGDMIYFAFSRLDERNQERVLRSHQLYVLMSFLIWPRHCFFLEVAKRCSGFLKRTSFLHVLRRILIGVKREVEGYAELVEEFWNLGPDKCKKYVIQRIDKPLFEDLCAIEDRRVIFKIFGSIFAKEKEQIFLSQGMVVSKLMVLHNCLGLFEDFLTKHLSSIESVTEFKEKFENFFTRPRNKDMIEEGQLQRARLVVDSILTKRKRQGKDASEHEVAVKRRRTEPQCLV